jgi:hypothetical protein
MVGEHPTQTILPGGDLRPAWRAACVAYREVRRTGARDEPAWKAARAAVLREFPMLSERAAGEQASDAICYASVYHKQWFWSGVGEAAESVEPKTALLAETQQARTPSHPPDGLANICATQS